MPTKVQVIVARTLTGDAQLSATLNGEQLWFSSGPAEAQVDAGRTNYLEWTVIGTAGSSYSIEVTNPKSAHCNWNGTLEEDGKDSGQCEFNT